MTQHCPCAVSRCIAHSFIRAVGIPTGVKARTGDGQLAGKYDTAEKISVSVELRKEQVAPFGDGNSF